MRRFLSNSLYVIITYVQYCPKELETHVTKLCILKEIPVIIQAVLEMSKKIGSW
jgi:hypothetical protein